MGRVVVDTNVLVSGIFFGGSPYKVLMLVLAGREQMVLSDKLYAEYERVCREMHSLKGGTGIEPLLALLRSKALWVRPLSGKARYCADPMDDMLFECALAAAPCTLVSGDKAVLAASIEGVHVMKPTEFLKRS
jgi:putative PIN family toxin of toxin-antitoxin system